MDAPTKRLPYRRSDPNAKGKRVKLTTDRLQRLYAIFTHGILSTEMVHALVDPTKSQSFTTRELKELFRAPNGYRRRR